MKTDLVTVRIETEQVPVALRGCLGALSEGLSSLLSDFCQDAIAAAVETEPSLPNGVSAETPSVGVTPPAASIPAIVPMRERMVRIAKQQAANGVREVPKNSNRGPMVEQYQAATWLEGSGWPWCAAFVCWVVREALTDYQKAHGVDQVPSGFKRPRTAGAWDFENWATQMAGRGVERFEATNRLIEPGDIVVFTFSHIGIAVGTATGRTPLSEVRTVEGNTDESGSREGGGVYAKVRRVSQIREVIRIQF